MENEKSLIEKVQNGNEEAFNELVSPFLQNFKASIANKYRLKNQDLDDIVQVAMIKAWKKISAFRGDSSFSTWFFRILCNEANSFLLKRQNREAMEESIFRYEEEFGIDPSFSMIFGKALDKKLDETASSILEKKELLQKYREIIEEVLGQLSPIHSQIINLVLNEEKSYEEVSNTLGIPIGTVMSRLFHAKKNAQKLIKNYANKDL